MLKLPLIAAFVAMLALTACGGGSGDNDDPAIQPASPAALTRTDLVVGSGAEAVAGKTATVTYTLWLYNGAATDFKGRQVESNQIPFVLGRNAVIPGFEQGVSGMKVGGKRVILVPSSLAYGAAGSPTIPANAGLVFEITLNKIE